jgi:PAP2 superfamily protein
VHSADLLVSEPVLGSDPRGERQSAIARATANLLVLRRTFFEHRALLLVAGAYTAAGVGFQLMLGRPWPIHLTTRWFITIWVWGSTIWLVAHVVGRRMGHRARLAGEQVWGAVLLATLAIPVQVTFQSIKQSIGPVRGFPWDDRLAAIDRILHGGPAWRWYAFLFDEPALLKLVDLFYLLWFIALAATIVWLCWTSLRALRQRALLALLILWIGGGNVAAWAFASAGPCYRADRDPQAATLLAQLDASNSALIARSNQQHLWAASVRDEWEPLGGVSAMPSLHVGLIVLVAIIVFRRSHYAGLLMWVYAGLVQVGSVILGWHYAIDGYAGALCAWGAWWLAGRISGGSAEQPEPSTSGERPLASAVAANRSM